jgi:hypothetical protein
MANQLTQPIDAFTGLVQSQRDLTQVLQKLSSYYPGLISQFSTIAIGRDYDNEYSNMPALRGTLDKIISELRSLPTQRIFFQLTLVESALGDSPDSILFPKEVSTAIRLSVREFSDSLEKYLAVDNRRSHILSVVFAAHTLFSVLSNTQQILGAIRKRLDGAGRLDGGENTSDMWSRLGDYGRVAKPSAEAKQTEYEQFTRQEKDHIRKSVATFRHLLVSEYNPTPEQLADIDRRLEYLAKKVDELNRVDWRGLALATVLGITTNLAVDTATGRRILELFQQAFAQALRLLGPG